MIENAVRPKVSLLWRYVIVGLLLLPAVFLGAATGFGFGEAKVVVFSSSLPAEVGRWQGIDLALKEDELSMLQSPSSSQKVYTDMTNGERVQVLLLQVNNTQNAHDPKICMRGSGYDLVSEEEIEAPWVGNAGRSYKITRAVFKRDSSEVTMFYWIQTSSGTIADMSSGLKLTGIVRAMKGQATRGVAVRIVCLPVGGQVATPAESGERLWSELNRSLDIERLVGGM